ncbi:MAG: [Lachnospiraceae bacterium]|nr:[FeFe] hydrogenase H-cluster radical SAM maturase HydE [Lachnospiraceae bacterium]
MIDLINKIADSYIPSKDELIALIDSYDNPQICEYITAKAVNIRKQYYDNKVYIRGLIEISNYCKNNCYYCGIRCGNKNVNRYRLSEAEILKSCEIGYKLGFKTFVLQGGEDPICDNYIIDVVKSIRYNYPDCAITLSLGEKSYEQYLSYYEAGANRYLLRHETATLKHYEKLHPNNLSLENRMKCLDMLKDIGYQTGSGFMVGSPYQTTENLANDLLYLARLKPHMIGIGPFISHKDTPFAKFPNGDLRLTLFLISLIRIMHPSALIPSTTALRTLSKEGHLLGISAGANVIMPNLSPDDAKKNYTLYDNKVYSGNEAAIHLEELKKEIQSIGYKIVAHRGDAFNYN